MSNIFTKISPAGEFLPLSCSKGTRKKKLQALCSFDLLISVTNICSFGLLVSCFNHFTAATEKGRLGIEIGSVSFLLFESLITCQNRNPEKSYTVTLKFFTVIVKKPSL